MKFILMLLVLTITTYAMGQINGLSSTKLSAFHAGTMGQYVGELEPTFSVTRLSGLQREDGQEVNDSIALNSSLCYRITFGVSDRLEFGFNAPSDVSYANVSTKYVFYSKPHLSFAAMAGIGTPLGNKGYRFNNPSIDDVSVYGLGLIGSVNIDSLTSIDINVHYQDYFRDAFSDPVFFSQNPILFPPTVLIPAQKLTGHSWIIIADVGTYALSDRVQCMLGGLYNVNVIDSRWSASLSTEAGVALEMTEKYAIVLAGNYSLWNKNLPQSFGLSLTFTTAW